MNIDFTLEQVKFLLEMINVLNFPGKEVENIYQLKQVIKDALEMSPK